jgi:pimeloyl-ACP methyl ester carboxylesterase
MSNGPCWSGSSGPGPNSTISRTIVAATSGIVIIPVKADAAVASCSSPGKRGDTLTPPPHDYSITDEVDGLLTHARRAGLDAFHLYGHSGGGAVAIAFTAAHPQRVLSLTLDEAASDFSEEMRADLAEHGELEQLMLEDPSQAMARFMQLELKPGVEFAPPVDGPPALPNRPGGIAALLRAFRRHQIDLDALRAFQRPVLYTRGSLSAERYERSARRLAEIFPDFREVVFEGVHHLKTSHQTEPARTAEILINLWQSQR